jgi:dTDP-4-dehydrorhamnose reductase
MVAERWLVTGGSGQLGSHVVRQLDARSPRPAILALRGTHEVGTPGVRVEQIPLEETAALTRCVVDFRPTHVVHLAAMTAVGRCHAEPEAARRVNVDATLVLAEAAREARFVFASTDMVFDGEHAPYDEGAPPAPLSEYGRTKVAAEQGLRERAGTLILRIPLMYGLPLTKRPSTFGQQIAALRAGEPLRLFTDEYRTPLWLGDAAHAVIGLGQAEVTGLWHLAGPRRLSRYELIAACARLLGVENPNLVAISRTEIAAAEPRPADLSLDATRVLARFPELAPRPMDVHVFGGGNR